VRPVIANIPIGFPVAFNESAAVENLPGFFTMRAESYWLLEGWNNDCELGQYS
jgi:hypothetical protein